MKTRDMCLVGILTAVLCLLGPLAVPIGPVSLSLTGFGVYVAARVLGPKNGMLAVLIYILLGMVGLPVFSGFTGGPARLIGPTGGYIAGYIPCAMIAGMGEARCAGLKMALGTLAMYGMGTMWFMVQSGTGVISALTTCVVPFVPGDILKIVAACAVVKQWNRIRKTL